MTVKSQSSCVMLQHLNASQQKSRKLRHNQFESPGARKVKFNEVCESGYSTTTSSDDGTNSPLKQMTSDKAFQLYAAPRDGFSNKTQPEKRHRKAADTQQYKHGFQGSQRVDEPGFTMISPSPSPTSPVERAESDESSAYYYVGSGFNKGGSYYDPLHLSNQQWKAGGYNDADSSDCESFHPGKRGILKKPTTLKLPESHKDEPQHASPSAFHPHGSQVSPIRVPAIYPNEHKTPSPLTSSDGSRKSAFTPVIPRSQRLTSGSDLSDVSSSLFTPVKGPAVVDYVASADVDLDADEVDFSPQHARTQPLLETQDAERGFRRHAPHPQPPQYKPSVPTAAPRSSKTIGDLQSLQLHNRRASTSTVESTTSSSPVPKVEALINDAVRLDEFLESCSAKDLKRLLREKLDSKDPRCIRALSVLIPNTVAKQTMSHCVRCHKNFDPRERGRCFLPHPESMVYKVGQDSEGANFHCQCCKTGFRLLKMDFYEESTNSLLTGHCYSGHHTTDPESVDYREGEGAAKSCEENGCVEFYV